MGLKKFIPTLFKMPLYWLLKAPQRKAGFFTVGLEFKGILKVYLDKFLFSKSRNLKPITICVSNKNRSSALLNYLVESILIAEHSNLISLSVFDCGSDDILSLEETLKSKLPGHIYFETQPIPFARSIAMNKAVKNAPEKLLLITDADISVPKDIVSKVNLYVNRNRVWFPICNAFTDNNETNVSWYTEGKGILACTKIQFENLGGYNETFTNWGGEDTDLWFRFWQQHYYCYRTKEKNLLHHWHPSASNAKKQW